MIFFLLKISLTQKSSVRAKLLRKPKKIFRLQNQFEPPNNQYLIPEISKLCDGCHSSFIF